MRGHLTIISCRVDQEYGHLKTAIIGANVVIDSTNSNGSVRVAMAEDC